MARKFQPETWATIVTLAALAVLLALGAWQMQRLQWKTALIAEINGQMAQPATPLPEKLETPESWKFRRVTMAGQFLYDHEFLIKPRTLEGKSGYHMVVPFRRASGGVVFVNRGWIADDVMTKAARPQGLLKIEGIVQFPQKARFTPENSPAKNDWYWPEISAMAEAANIKNAAPVLVVASGKEEGVYPVGGKIEIDLPNDHRQYAFFWFTMAGILLIIYFLYHWRPLKNEGV